MGRTSKYPASKPINTGILEAIEVVGSQVALAKLMCVAQPAVNHWLYYNVPAERAIAIANATGVAAAKIRPDLFAK